MSNLPIANKPTNDSNVNNFFNNYYNKFTQVSGMEHDAVLTFFLARTKGDKAAAEALSSSVMILAMGKGINPISIIDQFKHINDNQSFKAALVALLNSDRRPTSKLGYAATPNPDPYVTRNIHS